MRRRTVLLAWIASAALLGALAAVFVIPGSGPTVTVTSVNLVSSGGCVIDELTSGFSTPPGGEEQFSGQVLYSNPGTCTIDSVRSATPGFIVTAASVPIDVTSGTGTLSWVVQVPLFFHGSLTLEFFGTRSGDHPTPVNNSSCASPCISTQIPSDLYFYSFGAVLPSGWVVVEAGSVGAMVGAVAWTYSRRN